MQPKPKKTKRMTDKKSHTSEKIVAAEENHVERNENDMDIEENNVELHEDHPVQPPPEENIDDPNAGIHEHEMIHDDLEPEIEDDPVQPPPEENIHDPNAGINEHEMIHDDLEPEIEDDPVQPPPEENIHDPNAGINEDEMIHDDPAPGIEEGPMDRHPLKPGSNRQPPPSTLTSEYYAFPKYAEYHNRDQYYAQTYDGKEMYMTNPVTGNQEYAVKRTSSGELKSYPAKTSDGKAMAAMMNDGAFIYPDDIRNNSNFKNEYLIDSNGNQVYRYDAGGKIHTYLFDEHNEPMFAHTADQIPFYATLNRNGDDIEYAPVSSNGAVKFITKPNGQKQYLLNKSTETPIYEPDVPNDKPIYWSHNNVEYYESNSKGDEIYGKTSNGKDIYASNNITHDDILARITNGDEYYAKDEAQNEYYPINTTTNDQFYARSGTLQICAKKNNDVMFYAKDAQGDEYYPRIFVKNESENMNEI